MATPARITYTATIDASRDAVWHVLAERFGDIHQISDGVASSHYLTAQTEGVGTGRRCDLANGGFMEERVTVWEAPEALSIVIEDTSMPMAPGGGLEFILSEIDPDTTEVRIDGEFRLRRLAVLSPVMKPMMRRVVAGIVDDLARAS